MKSGTASFLRREVGKVIWGGTGLVQERSGAALQARAVVAPHGLHRTLESHGDLVERRLRDGGIFCVVAAFRSKNTVFFVKIQKRPKFCSKNDLFLEKPTTPHNFTRKMPL